MSSQQFEVLVSSGESRLPRAYDLAAYGALALGLVLRVLQFAANPSLWLDEATLSTSILKLDTLQLLKGPLLYGQSAPPGYLLVERLLVLCLGSDDWVLRLFPFASSLVALFAFWTFSRRCLSGIGRRVAMALFATAAPLVLFSGQAKQYSTDVAVATLLLLLGSTPQRAPRVAGLRWFAIVGGALAPWLSLPALFTLLGASSSLTFGELRDRAQRKNQRDFLRLSGVMVIWGVSCVVALRFNRAQVTPEVRRQLYDYWSGGFMPPVRAWSAALIWPGRAISHLFGGTESAGLYYPLRGFFVVLALGGAVSLVRRLPRAGISVVAPVVLALVAAGLHQYPFADRLVMFLIPNLLLAVAEATGRASELLSARSKLLGTVLAVGVCCLAAYPGLAPPAPYVAENLKPLLRELKEQRRPGEPLYVYGKTLPAFGLYLARGSVSGSFIAGGRHNAEREYLVEMDQFRGQPRVWLLFAHAWPEREHDDMLRYLDAIGTRLARHIVPARGPAHSSNGSLPAMLYLFDLSDSERGRAASAANFEISEPAEQ